MTLAPSSCASADHHCLQIPLVPPDYESNQAALERIERITILFQRLRKHFSQAVRAWERFSGDGDIMYFRDLSNNHMAKEALSSIKKSFEKIVDLEQRLTLMEKKCDASARIAGTFAPIYVSILTVSKARTAHDAREQSTQHGKQSDELPNDED